MAMAMGKPLSLTIPKPILNVVGTGMDYIGEWTNTEMPLSMNKVIEGTSEHWICSADKAKQQFDFQPLHSVDDTLTEVVKGYRQLGML